MATVRRFFQSPRGSFFLFGPRGTGKSTWLRGEFPDALWLDLLDPATQRLYSARPERLRDAVAMAPASRDVVIDEIQKVPALLDVVHQLMEEDAGRRFVLTGSSARKLRRAGGDLLAGRAAEMTMHPFMAAELGAGLGIGSALELGLLPVVVSSPDPARALGAYIGVYLEQEVQAEALVRNVGGFSRFLEVMAFSHGAGLNISAVASRCQVKRKTVEGYVGVLEDLLLGFRLPVFTRRARRHLAHHPKFYYFDAGVFRSLRPMGSLDASEEAAGGALEGLVAQHLRAWIAYGEKRRGLHYWRTKSGAEIDFVVYGEDTFAALEVKSGRTVRPSDVRTLRSFREDYPEAEVRLLYGGGERVMVGDVPCLPCEEFLRELIPGRALPIE